MDRLFLDANVLFSAAYRSDSGLVRLWRLRGVDLLTSTYALEEAHRNLAETEQRERLEELVSQIRVVAEAPGGIRLPVDLPEKDRPILLAAISARASHLLTGDVADFGHLYGRTVQGVLVLRPADYLRARVESRGSRRGGGETR